MFLLILFMVGTYQAVDVVMLRLPITCSLLLVCLVLSRPNFLAIMSRLYFRSSPLVSSERKPLFLVEAGQVNFVSSLESDSWMLSWSSMLIASLGVFNLCCAVLALVLLMRFGVRGRVFWLREFNVSCHSGGFPGKLLRTNCGVRCVLVL